MRDTIVELVPTGELANPPLVQISRKSTPRPDRRYRTISAAFGRHRRAESARCARARPRLPAGTVARSEYGRVEHHEDEARHREELDQQRPLKPRVRSLRGSAARARSLGRFLRADPDSLRLTGARDQPPRAVPSPERSRVPSGLSPGRTLLGFPGYRLGLPAGAISCHPGIRPLVPEPLALRVSPMRPRDASRPPAALRPFLIGTAKPQKHIWGPPSRRARR